MTFLDCVPALLSGATTFFAVLAWRWRGRARAADAAALWALRDRDRIIRAARRGDDRIASSASSFAAMISPRALDRAGRDLARRDYRALVDVLGRARPDPACPEARLDPCQSAALELLRGRGGDRDLVVRIIMGVRGLR